jgi:L-asparaginase
MNLLEAVRVAVDPATPGMGVLGVVNDEIHAARDVRKTTSHRVDAWNSGDSGDLGQIDRDRVSYYRKPIRKHTSSCEFDVTGLTDLPKVYVLISHIGADGVLIEAAVKDGHAKGLVLAGFPTGTGTPEQAKALLKVAASGIPVVDSHRGGRGRPAGRYPEFVDGDNLTPQQARLLLALALTKTSDRKAIQKMFEEY